MSEERLQKVLARAGVSSRRKAEGIIAAGRVSVNGDVVRQVGVKVDPKQDEIAVDGEVIEREPREYWALNKPTGVITTVDDPYGRPTALDLLSTDARVYPVGRLDADSSGLLLLTNDGQLAYRLTHPSFEHDKEYEVRVRGRPGPAALKQLRGGMMLEGEERPTAPATVEHLRSANGDTWLRMVLHEGRNRQIRRMMDAVGHPVVELVRVRIGPLKLGDLPVGEARRLTPQERLALRALVERG